MAGINLQELETIAREQVLPAIENQISKEPSPFLEKIAKPVLTSQKIDVLTGVGMNGGFGFGGENLNIPESGGQKYEHFSLSCADMYGTINISNKALTLGVNDKGVNLLLNETEGIKNSMVWNMGRSLFGNGNGVLCTVTANNTASTTIGVSTTKHLMEGFTVDIYATGATVGSTPAHAKKRIIAIDRVQNTVTIEGSGIVVAAGFMTIQGSYGREIFGIDAFFDNNVTSIYGVTKAGNTWLQPSVYTAAGSISDTLISKAVRESEDYRRSKIDMVLAGDTAYDAYVEYMKESKTMNVSDQNFWGGVAGLGIVANGRKIVVVHERHVGADEMIGVDTTQFLFPKTTMDFISQDGRTIFERLNNSTVFHAVLGCYGNLLCKNPGGIFKITNCSSAT